MAAGGAGGGTAWSNVDAGGGGGAAAGAPKSGWNAAESVAVPAGAAAGLENRLAPAEYRELVPASATADSAAALQDVAGVFSARRAGGDPAEGAPGGSAG